LIPNLAIAREDFKRIEFEQAGATWNGMDRDFDGALADLIADLNETVASWPGCVHLLYNVVTEADMGELTVGVRELKAHLSESPAKPIAKLRGKKTIAEIIIEDRR